MGVSRADVDSVKYDMQALLRELDAMSYSTFPDGDAEQQRFLDVVRAWATVSWDALTVGQAAQKMTEMLPSLREVCALRCANLHYTEAIQGIRGQIVRICLWYEQAGARAAVREAAAAAVEAETKKASRPVEAFASVTVVGGEATASAVVMLTDKRREALRKAVKEMRMNILTLKREAEDFDRDKLSFIAIVEGYHQSCCGDNTWIWDASAWGEASHYLYICLNAWKKLSKGNDEDHWFPRLKRECEQCVQDMAEYKRICSDPAATSWGARMRKLRGLDAKVEALKLCV
jgi:hypothetical protein